MDALRLTAGVSILRADDDAGMVDALTMEANEVASIDRQHGALGLGCIGQHRFVRNALASVAGFGAGQHVMTQSAQFAHDGVGEILVGVETGYQPRIDSQAALVATPTGLQPVSPGRCRVSTGGGAVTR